MNISPLLYFAYHHGTQLKNLAESGKGNARKWLDLAYAVTPWLKKYYPQVNDQRLWEDALDTVENMISDNPQTITHMPDYPDPTQR